jgi:hypothetical protein
MKKIFPKRRLRRIAMNKEQIALLAAPRPTSIPLAGSLAAAGNGRSTIAGPQRSNIFTQASTKRKTSTQRATGAHSMPTSAQ